MQFRPLTLEVHLPSEDCKLVGLTNNVLLVIDAVGLNKYNFHRLSLIQLHQIFVRSTCFASEFIRKPLQRTGKPYTYLAQNIKSFIIINMKKAREKRRSCE
jgi:hypothetical protein